MRHHVDVRASLGKVGVNEIAEHWQDGTDEDRRETPIRKNRKPPTAIPTIVMMIPKIFEANATSSFV